MAGTLALVGSGEFLEPMKPVDERLLELAGGTKVVVLPTASAPDGPGVPERWARMGIDHYNALGAQTHAVMALDRAGCADPALAEQVRAADLVYLSGGKPDYLHSTLDGTPVWQAIMDVLDRGGVVAGCSAGAMIMGAWLPAFTGSQRPVRVAKWQPGFALVPRAVIAPHYDEFPESLSQQLFGGAPGDSFLIGVDGNTALVGFTGHWTAMGRGRVTLRRGGQTTRYADGDTVPV